MIGTLNQIFFDIISTIGAWCYRFVDILNSTIRDLLDNSSWLKELLANILLPDSVLDAKLYVVLFGTGALIFVFTSMVKMFIK